MGMSITSKGPAAALAALLIAGSIAMGQSSPVLRDRHVEAALVGESTHLQPGVPYRVGLLLRHDAKWHTYWKSTATGYATSIDWKLPPGFTVSGLSWPTPKVYSFQGYAEFVYDGEVLLTATLTPPTDLPQGAVEIGFTAEWLMCADVCVPGKVSSKLVLEARDAPAAPSAQWAAVFAAADRALPAGTGPYRVSAHAQGRTVTLEVAGAALPANAYFFDATATFRPEPAAQPVDPQSRVLRLNLVLDDSAGALPQRLNGVLKGDPGWPGAGGSPSLAIDVPISATPPAATAAATGTSWAGILTLAFLGGLVLNLMPCVFPVLGIKIMGFVSQAGEARGKVMGHGLVFSAGVLLSFWALAGLLLVLRSGGQQLGWGFQLQSPGFVLALALLLFAFGLNLSGLFEVGQSAVGAGARLTAKSGLAGSFFSGVLATVVATPCAAPFLAPALGAALALPPAASIAVFTLIALGLALPYLLLSAFPGLIRHLPRPGAWMETFKQAMSFLLYASVAYLVWVLAGQLTEDGGYAASGLLKALLALVLLAVGLWVYGRWAAFHRKRATRAIGMTAAAVLLLAALAIGFSGTRKQDASISGVQWQEWEPGKAEALAAAGKVVYVDFTARWCVTCQTNKAAVFGSAKVRERIAALDAVLLKADWTHQDPRISEALAAFSRSAVPFNLVYGPAAPQPLVLPELLTPGIVLEALDQAAR